MVKSTAGVSTRPGVTMIVCVTVSCAPVPGLETVSVTSKLPLYGYVWGMISFGVVPL